MSVPNNVNKLEPELQRIIRSDITLDEDEIKHVNRNLQSVLLGSMEEIMKQDETFRTLYKEPQYTGSYYENLRVASPNEFDINLVLELPIKEEYIYIDTAGTQPGFARIKVQRIFKPSTPIPVKGRIENWFENDYLSQSKVISWLQGIVDSSLTRIRWPASMNVVTVRRSTSGPAVTLHVNIGEQNFDVDFVPVFRFGRDKWPSYPLRQANNLPRNINSLMKWCVVPKAPRDAKTKDQWRMSFYMIEKELMRDLNNMKPVIKLFKLLRDKQGWSGLSSYYIKTLFMWEQENKRHEANFWRKGLGHLFMHMLIKLEECLRERRIKFFWHEGSNLIAHLDADYIRNMAGRAAYLRKLIERALNDPGLNLTETMGQVFTTPQSRVQPQSQLQYAGDGAQESSTIGWGGIVTGAILVGAAAVFAGLMAGRRNNQQ